MRTRWVCVKKKGGKNAKRSWKRKKRAEGEGFPLSPLPDDGHNAQRAIPTDIVNSHRARERGWEEGREGERVRSLRARGVVDRYYYSWHVEYPVARAVDHAYRLFTNAISPLFNSSRDRDTSFHCPAYTADKPIASAVDVNAFVTAVTISLVRARARAPSLLDGVIRIVFHRYMRCVTLICAN